MSKLSLLADAANLATGITFTAPALLDAAPLSGPVTDAGKELLTGLVGIALMFLTKAAGKLLDKWFSKKEKPVPPVVEPHPEKITLQKPLNNGNEKEKISK